MIRNSIDLDDDIVQNVVHVLFLVGRHDLYICELARKIAMMRGE